MGYFLQPIYVQKLKKKIYFYDELVREMETEFKQRVSEKRDVIKRMKQRHKEYALTEATLVCERCLQDIAPMKTFEFINNELHYAKCVFGTLRRIEMEELFERDENDLGKYEEDKDFIDIYLNEFDAIREVIAQSQRQKNPKQQPSEQPHDRAFAKCRNDHVLGLVVDKKFYVTDISQVKLVFPNCHYEDWDSRWWAKGYPEIGLWQQKTLLNRAQACFKDQWQADQDEVLLIDCELCKLVCKGPDEFVAHCASNPRHKELEKTFSSTLYDYLFDHPLQ